MATTEVDNNTIKNGISKETSQRICDHMNDDHAVSVYGMAKQLYRQTLVAEYPGWTVTGATLTTVTMTGATMNVVLCRRDKEICRQINDVVYPFVPPLTEPHQIRSRMVAIHHQVCRPTDCYDHLFLPAMVVFVCIVSLSLLSFYSAFGMMNQPILQNVTKACLYLLLMIHMGMAMYGTYLCSKKLKLKRWGILNWYIAISVCGWWGMKELFLFIDVDTKCKAIQITKKSL